MRRLIAVFALFTCLPAAYAVERATSHWVRPDPDGKLVYKTTERGDRIMDFSHAGYMGGGVAIPEVPVARTIQPSGGDDDTAAIQGAINEVAAMPLQDGRRGAVLLGPGTFTCSETITIPASGVVLRGSGSGEGGSTIRMTGRPHLAISARTGGRRGGQPEIDDAATTRTTIADAYVPSGATSFHVADAKGLAVGDWVSIRRPVTEAWVKFMGMHDMTRDGRPQTWIRAGTVTMVQRRIAAVAGNQVTLDVPLSDSYDARYLNPPGTTVAKIPPPVGLSQVGIERLHIECPPQEISHSQAHFTAIRLSGQDCWIRDLVIDETMNSVGVSGRRITLQRVTINRKARHQGASRPAEFAPNAAQVLLDRCAVSADNVWFVATGGGVPGPMVILNCAFTGNGRAESHQRWSTGLLYDNCRAPGGAIELRNRGSMGSGHGWSVGWGVVWNCLAEHYIIQSPPGALNWLIGSVGDNRPSPRPFGSGPNLPEGVIDSPGRPVAPQSLYLAQLAERLGPEAIKNIGYASPDLPATGPPAPRSHVPTSKNLAVDRPVTTTNVRQNNRNFAGWQAIDGDDATYWATDDGKIPATLELDTEGALAVSAVAIAEARDLPPAVRGYKVEGFTDSAWKALSHGTTIGDRKLDRFPETTVWKVRLTILDAQPYAAIREFALYHDGGDGSP